MKKLLIILMLLSPTAQATTPACMQMGEIAETIMIARQAGMPKLAMVATLKISNTGVRAMDNFALNLVDEAYDIPRHNSKGMIVDAFTTSIIKACNKMITKHEVIKAMGIK